MAAGPGNVHCPHNQPAAASGIIKSSIVARELAHRLKAGKQILYGEISNWLAFSQAKVLASLAYLTLQSTRLTAAYWHNRVESYDVKPTGI